jgi:hypothetical protein
MRVFIALIAAGCLVFGSVVSYRLVAIGEEMAALENRVESGLNPAARADDAPDADARWSEVDARLTQLEATLRSRSEADDREEAAVPAKVSEQIATLTSEIDALRSDIESTKKVRGFLDNAADRMLATAGQDSKSETDGGSRGMARLAELGELFGKQSDELTDEELDRRDEVMGQFRRRQAEWAVSGFNRTLEAKLTEDQEVVMGDILAEERASLDDLRKQELDDEQRTAARKEIEAGTDQRAAEVLSLDQHEAWTKYRSQPRRRGFSFGRRR